MEGPPQALTDIQAYLTSFNKEVSGPQVKTEGYFNCSVIYCSLENKAHPLARASRWAGNRSRSCLYPTTCQLLNFSNWTNIKGDIRVCKICRTRRHVRRILKMSGEGFWSCGTKCLARVNQGQCMANKCQAKSLIFAGQFTVKCPARIQNVWRRTGCSSDKISGDAQMNCTYSADIAILVKQGQNQLWVCVVGYFSVRTGNIQTE